LIAVHVGAPVSKPNADFVRSATGFAIGGVPPLGHNQPILTLIDEDLLLFGTVWAAGGTPRAVFSVAPRQLAQAVGGRVVAVAERTHRP
jgi:prolyl-tRNA editing enzyme YbaK/EbsC (Cys-tRNA(Pro) deacylase)